MGDQTHIRPGRPWLDTKGERIQAHGGSILHVDGTFYWYGENKEKTVPGSGVWHWGIRCYASQDLYNWQDLGLIIPPEPDDPASPMHPAKLVDRPHIIHDRAAGRFVCWLKLMGEVQESTVLVADAIEGPYRIVRTGLRPLGMSAGDFDLVVDPHDGKGYYYIALADRWLPDVPAEVSAMVLNRMATMLAAGAGVPEDAPSGLSEPNTSVADYVWLPIRFDGDMPVLDWHDEWRIEDFGV